jgi:hypothetical protein
MNKLIAISAAAIGLAFLVGCNSSTTVTEYLPDGKTITKVTATSHESPLTHKTFSTSGSVTAIDVETSVSSSGGNVMPHVIIGGSAVSISSAASDDNKPTLGYSWSAGIVKSITSSSATSGALTYTGVKGETADETAKRINAILKLNNVSGLTESSEPDSATKN